MNREAAITGEVNDAIGWDDRKMLLDAWQNAGMRVERITPDLYEALITVAQVGARRVAENLIAAEGRAKWRRCTDQIQLADALDRAQAASEGVDLLIAQAERRGAVKALRAEATRLNYAGFHVASAIVHQGADAIQTGADW